MANHYKSINDIVKDLTAGSTISQENYEKLTPAMQ
jgi:hypothetical protein